MREKYLIPCRDRRVKARPAPGAGRFDIFARRRDNPGSKPPDHAETTPHDLLDSGIHPRPGEAGGLKGDPGKSAGEGDERRKAPGRPDQGNVDRQAEKHQGSVPFSQAGPDSHPGLDRPRGRRPLLFVVWSRGSLQDAGDAYVPGAFSGRGHGPDGLHHFQGVRPHHRIFSLRRRRIRRGHSNAGSQGRGPLRGRPAGGLCPDHHRLDRLLRGGVVQLSARLLA